MTLEKAKSDITEERPVSIPLSSMNRFWFYPGKNRYTEDKGVVIIKECPVILLTEEEYLDNRGEMVGSGRPDPLAQRFTESFSTRYAEIARQRPIYTELENLFRFVALAKIMRFKSSDEEARLDLDYLLEDYPLSRTSVKQELPGRSNVKRFEHRQDFENGYQINQLWLPSCGGVGMDIAVSQRDFVENTTENVSRLRGQGFKYKTIT
ncbi:hypothetical protein KJ693_01180 [bacterium]|nr:hypothetical protein [bacterium]MBU1613903.1 hypothetical protein [bacterium]